MVLSEFFQAILIENHTCFHHLTEADSFTPKGYFPGLFSRTHLGCLPIFQGHIEHSKVYILLFLALSLTFAAITVLR